ncbi:hypothetical protein BXT84_03860 [Sulfobacillus thermotolerans]|uniref:Stage II sporulation protein P n=1 Tax=Sulfobacillus thermotolerans TaxID=338644 RepID=A0ABM6RPE0_9FIRM|nr:hypothetical protein BXT84_03860 [Sulfobacillus thermotolerans]
MPRPSRRRRPAIIWFKWSKPSRKPGRAARWKRRLPLAGAPPQETFRPFLPKRFPWTSLSLYGMVLVMAALIFIKVPARTGAAVPVTGPIGTPRQTSWLDRTLHAWQGSSSSFLTWIEDGIPLSRLSQASPRSTVWHVRSVIMTALADISGVRLTSLTGILRMEIPALATVSLPNLPSRTATGVPRLKEQDAVEPGLPGDHQRVWAELGKQPIVGIYQTHSHESFWPSLPKNAPTAYSTDWSKTVVQVGWWLAQDLHSQGVAVVQSRVDNMSQGLLPSYNESYHTAKRLLRWYPTVHILVDIHRSEKPLAETTAKIHGVSTARILLIVGSNKLLPNPYWHQNLELAIHVAHHLAAIAPGILEGDGIDMVPYRYNQQLAPGDLLIEVGGQYNTLAQERYAVNDLARALALVVRDKQYP